MTARELWARISTADTAGDGLHLNADDVHALAGNMREAVACLARAGAPVVERGGQLRLFAGAA